MSKGEVLRKCLEKVFEKCEKWITITYSAEKRLEKGDAMNYDGMMARFQEISRAIPNMAITPDGIRKADEALLIIVKILEMKMALINAPKVQV